MGFDKISIHMFWIATRYIRRIDLNKSLKKTFALYMINLMKGLYVIRERPSKREYIVMYIINIMGKKSSLKQWERIEVEYIVIYIINISLHGHLDIQVFPDFIRIFQTFNSPLASPVNNSPPGLVWIILITSSLQKILPLSSNLLHRKKEDKLIKKLHMERSYYADWRRTME